MNPPLPFPGSRTVAAWWRELAPRQPTRLWLSHLFIHRVEALVEVADPFHIKGLPLELLRSIPATRPLSGLDPAFQGALTRALIDGGFIARAGPEVHLTDAGTAAATTGSGTLQRLERRSFSFLDNGPSRQSPHLLCLRRPATPVTPPEPWEFEPGCLQQAVSQDQAWKDRFGFPLEVVAVRLPEPNEGDARTLILDRAEHLFVAFIQTDSGEGTPVLQGFAARGEGWVLEGQSPAIELGDEWQQVLPALAAEPSEEDWRTAWRPRAEQLGLSSADLSACRFEVSGVRLRIEVPAKAWTRLRGPRPTEAQSDEWLLAGEERTRSAVRVELVRQTS